MWASCGPWQFTHLSMVWLQGRPRMRQVAVGQVWFPVGCGEAHHRHETGLVHWLLWFPYPWHLERWVWELKRKRRSVLLVDEAARRFPT